MGRATALWERVPLPAEHAVGLGVALLLQRAWPRPRLPAQVALGGWPLVAAGVALQAWAVVARHGEALDRPAGLVTDGPHAWTRNPIYVGWALLHAGAGLVARSPWLLGTWPASVALLHRVVLGEEQELARRFGEEFSGYRARVPRYVGLPRRGT